MSYEGLIRTLRAMAARPVTTDELLDAIEAAHGDRTVPLREYAVHHIAAAFRVDYLIAAYVAAARRFEGDRPWSAPARLDEMTAMITAPFRAAPFAYAAPEARPAPDAPIAPVAPVAPVAQRPREPRALGLVRKTFARRAPRTLLLQPNARGAELADLLSVNARSVQYAMCAGTGGVLVDDWLHILGGGNDRVRSNLASWNGLGPNPTFAPIKRATLVAFDVVGGLYAVDHGALKGATPHEVFYFSPATLEWAPTGRSYTALLDWSQAVELFEETVAPLRWPGWRDTARCCSFDEAIAPAPGDAPPGAARRVIPAVDCVLANFEAARARHGEPLRAPRRPSPDDDAEALADASATDYSPEPNTR